MKIVLEMLFLFLSNIDIKFAKLEKLTWRLYIAIKALLTTISVEFINKRDILAIALDENAKTFIIHIATLLTALTIQIYLLCQAQVKLLLVNKITIKVLFKYLNFADVFTFDFAIELSENININEYAIKLIDWKKPLYKLIYIISLVELETLYNGHILDFWLALKAWAVCQTKKMLISLRQDLIP